MEKNKLNLQEIYNIDKKYKEVKEIKIMNGQYILNIRPNMSFDDMEKIIEDIGKFLQDKKVLNIIGQEPVAKYLTCFIVKYQTDLFDNLDNVDDNLKELDVFKILLKSGCVDDVLNNINNDDLAKLYDRFNKIMNAAKELIELNKITKINEIKEKDK